MTRELLALLVLPAHKVLLVLRGQLEMQARLAPLARPEIKAAQGLLVPPARLQLCLGLLAPQAQQDWQDRPARPEIRVRQALQAPLAIKV